ncbi:hypothetical protein HKD37_18G049951 [Glycine soja]
MTTSFPFTSMSLEKGLEFPGKTSDLCFSLSPNTELLKGDTTDCGESIMISTVTGNLANHKELQESQFTLCFRKLRHKTEIILRS